MATFSRFLATLQLVAPEDADQCGKQPYLDWPRRVVQLLPCNLLHRNEQAGFVSHWLASDAAAYQGVTVTKTDIPGTRLVSESVAELVLSNIFLHLELNYQLDNSHDLVNAFSSKRYAHMVGVVQGVRATGIIVIIPGGLAAGPAQSAALF
ncbi:hypothetical protein DKX38_015369 [Salix brachista]|uniref:Uncharacterized protein n=1 Tax=Salix brachista TaxID=2182728 RepID=A0A5N5L709_9ROSI|nr:hypothetical protein DKX38_015369 [Salix brachista]